jgi:zinc and cadmium transporter
MVFWIALISVVIVSLISLVGAVLFLFNYKRIENIMLCFVSFATGALIAAALLDLVPEAQSLIGAKVFIWVLLGILAFLFIEKFLQWHHHHYHKKHLEKAKTFTYLNLVGDAAHNFLDGAGIMSSYLIDFNVGISATIAVIAHEIPQELGDFAILLYGGWKTGKALLFNFLSALTAVFGALLTYWFFLKIEEIVPYLAGFAAGSFLYIALADMLPEITHKKQTGVQSFLQLVLLLFGIALIWAIKSFF